MLYRIFLLLLSVIVSPLYFHDVYAESAYQDFIDGVEEFTLKNGMRFLVFERDVAPVFHAHVWVKVGGSDEEPGKTGAAHLLEHMAFKGTRVIGTKDYEKEKELIEKYDALLESNGDDNSLKEIKEQLREVWNQGEYTRLLEQHGGRGLNAGTSADYTNYTVALPSSELEFWFYMESERVLNPVFRQFYEELDVVLEERRMRTEDRASGRLYEAILGVSYWGHPYHSPTIGWKGDLLKLRRKDAQDLHEKYYRPDNMVVALVGDLDIREVKRLAEIYFARLKKPQSKLEFKRVSPAEQDGRRLVEVPFDSEPEFLLSYHHPAYPHRDALAISILHSILDDGRSSILQRELVQRRQILSSVFTALAPGQRHDPVFLIGGQPSRGVSYEKAEGAVRDLILNLPISEKDVEKAKKSFRAELFYSLKRNKGIASLLGYHELIYDDWKSLFVELEQLNAVSVDDIKKVIARYFSTDKETVARIVAENK